MAFAGSFGAKIDLSKVPFRGEKTDCSLLFSESNTRFIIEVSMENSLKFERLMAGNVFARIGAVTNDPRFAVKGLRGKYVID